MNIKLGIIVAISGLVPPFAGLAQNPPLITTFTNPTPVLNDWFGYALAAVGNDRVLIGAYGDDTGAVNSGAAYLFSINGALLTTITNPTPQGSDYFGIAVAALESDRVLIGVANDSTGAPYTGAAYLFRTNGTLLTTFTNPTPSGSDAFGTALAGLGSDRVLIGAYSDNTAAADAGAVYLFATNGTLLRTFTNPVPAGDAFGSALAAVGNDRVLIGAYGNDTGAVNSGVAYLYSTNGTLLTTFTNPTPAGSDFFGFAVAALGNDRLLIGAYGDDRGASGAGAAYLFNTNGTLLATITNPVPVADEYLGYSVAAVGTDRVLIGAPWNGTGGTRSGAAYLFNTNGVLLNAITNPTPADFDVFGIAVAGVGGDRVLIGAYNDDIGADSAGAAYLFSLAPLLTIVPAGAGQATISWAPNSPGYILKETAVLSPPDWTNSPSGATNPVTIPAASPAKFYRLFKP